MTYILMAGGPIQQVPLVDKIIKEYPDAHWIGVDRGVFILLKHGIEPEHAFGDFDSLTKEERDWIDKTGIKLNVFPCEKDETDMEIALKWTLKQHPSQVILFGGTGGRLDHLFMNAQLILQGLQQKIPVYIQDRWNKLTIWNPGTYTIETSNYPYVSLIPHSSEVKGLMLEGFRYPLVNASIKQGSSQCVSNEIIANQGTITFSEGRLYVFQTMDEITDK
ncbi:thiamine diphosphokinase [Salipaludibacillus sp. HK11]|uniref:thiamine diphosphokinase n=1 Tax=Salipaludibacillus sp. HK11 TaxID=3394320 RepID=UPI0039FC5E09